MTEKELLKIGFLLRLFGRRYTASQYIMPDIFRKQFSFVDHPIMGFGPSHFIFNVPKYILTAFNEYDIIDSVWTRIGVCLIKQAGTKRFLALKPIMPLRIMEHNVLSALKYDQSILDIIMMSYVMYKELLTCALSAEEKYLLTDYMFRTELREICVEPS